MTPITRNTVPIILLQICFYLFFMCNILKAQCIADAGDDIIVCINEETDTTIIGGIPSASNGTTPYQYTWEASYYDILGILRTASFFLNDTTLANPSVVERLSNSEEVIFKLTVIDANGSSCVDSITVKFSVFMVQITDYFWYTDPGDSVQLYSSTGGGIYPLSYSWHPSESLIDANVEDPIAFPDTTTYYILTVTDAAGCVIQNPDINEVYVTTTSTEYLNESAFNFKLYPNPAKRYLNIELNNLLNGFLSISFFSLNGETLGKDVISKKKTTIEIPSYKDHSVILYQIKNLQGYPIKTGKLIIRYN